MRTRTCATWTPKVSRQKSGKVLTDAELQDNYWVAVPLGGSAKITALVLDDGRSSDIENRT